MLKQMLIAGFGGQGVMAMGQLLVYSGLLEGKEVAWLPSYGPEMRGGTANCAVSISDFSISSPLVTEPDILIAMNYPALEKFERLVKNGGKILVNSSIVTDQVARNDINVYYIPINKNAEALGESRVANMVMLGALLKVEPIVEKKSLLQSLSKVLSGGKNHLLPLNERALELGAGEIII